MFSLIARGFLLGIGAATPIGPVNIEIARRTLTRGLRAGFALGCGAVTIDVGYFIITGLGLATLSQHPAFYRPMQIVGALILGYMGVMSWRRAFSGEGDRINGLHTAEQLPSTPPPVIDGQSTFSILRGGYITGLLMTFFSPLTLVFWFSAGSAAAGGEQRRGEVPIMCIGVLAATLGWVVIFTSALKLLRRWRRQWWMMAANGLGGTILLGVAGYALWTSLPRFL